jgi:glycosyltransferase involved in cell wall biosynthesis
MLSYLFPPRGGPGVQRALKFAKYLPQFGWRPLVLASADARGDNVVKVEDPTLLRDLPGECVVRYTTPMPLESGRLFQTRMSLRQRLAATDPMGWWVEPAVQASLKLLREHKADAILVTMSPFTAAEAGIRLKRLTGLPLILDLRDPWAMDETRIYPTRWHTRVDWAAMHRAMAAADLVIMNTSEAASAVKAAFVLPATTRVITLTNGFDPEDFLTTDRQTVLPAADALRIVHVGIFHTELALVWDDVLSGRGWRNRLKHARRPINLWTRTPRYLLAAMERLICESRISPQKLELVLVGEPSARDEALIASSPLRERVRVLGYRSHAESVEWMRSADVLFLPLHTPLDGGPALVVPGKTYEYLGSGRPILAMGPPGDMRRFVRELNCGIAIDGDDVAGAADALERMYQAKRSGRRLFEPDYAAIARFNRRELTRRLAEALDSVLGHARTPSQLSPDPSPLPL